MEASPELCTIQKVKALTRKLAREAFFSNRVLMQSTVTGKSSGLALDEHKLEMMQAVLRAKLYPDMTIVWPQCKAALGSLCKSLRHTVKENVKI